MLQISGLRVAHPGCHAADFGSRGGGSVRSDASDFEILSRAWKITICASDFGTQGGPFVPTIQILRYSPGHGRSLFGEPTFLFVFR